MDTKELRHILSLRSDLAIQAIQNGQLDKAIDYIKEYREEMKFIHQIMAEMMWALVTYAGREHGENEVGNMWKFRQEVVEGVSAGLANKKTEDIVRICARVWRAHNTNFTIIEEKDRFVFTLNPCSTGGEMLSRKLDKPPTNFGKVQKAHPWTWGKKDVSFYCAHCCFHELAALESGAKAPYWVVQPPQDEKGICVWYVYKNPDLVPKEFIHRLRDEV